MFSGYFGTIRIGDGIEGHYLDVDGSIVCRTKDKTTVTFITNGHAIQGYKVVKSGKIIEHEILGKFYKEVNPKGKVILNYHSSTRRGLHGLAVRGDQRLFNTKGSCKSIYSRGRFLKQEFRYDNRKLAYKFNHTDKKVLIKYPSGKIAAVIECPNKGFSTRISEPGYWDNDVHSCYKGTLYFSIDKINIDSRGLDFSKDGNCLFKTYDRRGRLKHQGAYKNRQKVGAWILQYKPVYFIKGMMVPKYLWDMDPAKLNITTTLKIKNTQLRSIMIERIGPERISKECKHKVIHKTKNGMKLMEFPVKLDDGNGSEDSKMRILQVTCPSTGNKYFLNVPDFVWDGGKMTKLNKCEQARQWTFGVNDPKKAIVFYNET